jgi:hypothetical protein
VDLVYKILGFAQTFVYFDALANLLSYNISAIVFFATLIIGYLIIISKFSKREERYPEEHIEKRRIKDKMSEKKRKEFVKDKRKYSESNFSWREVKDEFRKVFLNLGKALNRAFEGKKKKKDKIKK